MSLYDTAFGTEIDSFNATNFGIARIITHKNTVTNINPLILSCGPSYAALGASGTGTFIENGKTKNILSGKANDESNLRGRWNGTPIDAEGGTLSQWYTKLAAQYKETGILPNVQITTSKEHISYSLAPRGQYKNDKWYHFVVKLGVGEVYNIDTTKLGLNVTIFSIDDNDISVNGVRFNKVSLVSIKPTTTNVEIVSHTKDTFIMVLFRNSLLDTLSTKEVWDTYGYVICKGTEV